MTAKAQQFDFLLSQVRADGVALIDGWVTFYEAGTTTLKTVWLDRNKTTPAANPYQLSADAQAQLYGDGLYKVVIESSADVVKYTYDNVYIKSPDIGGKYITDYPSLTAAVTAIGAVTPTRLIINDATSLTSHTTITDNIEIEVTKEGSVAQGAYDLTNAGIFDHKGIITGTGAFTNTGKFLGNGGTINTSGAITINGTATISHYHIFLGSGAVTFGRDSAPYVVPQWWGAKGDYNGTTGNDDTAAILAAIASVTTSRGDVFFPVGIYKTTGVVLVPKGVNLRGVYSQGAGLTYNGQSIIYGVHTGAAVVSLKGAHGNKIENITIYGNNSSTPKTGLLLGRSSAASAGLHSLINVSVKGYFGVAAVYSIASEQNSWVNLDIILVGGAAKYGFYTSQGDDKSVDSLTGSSNLDCRFYGIQIISQQDLADAAGIYMNLGVSTFSWSFFGGYIIPKNGSYIEIASGLADGQACPGPISFYGVAGEIYAGGGEPQYGYKILGNQAISGLTIEGSKFPTRATTGNFIFHGANVPIKDSRIKCSAQNNASALTTAQFTNSQIDLGNTQEKNRFYDEPWTSATLTNSWANYGNGHYVTGYYKDSLGWVHLKGVIQNGTIGSSAFTLPEGYRPEAIAMFPAIANGNIIRVDVSNADGTVKIYTSNTLVSLNGISFRTQP